MKVIKLHSIKVRAKADIMWQLMDLKDKHAEPERNESCERCWGRADSFHSNKEECSFMQKFPF